MALHKQISTTISTDSGYDGLEHIEPLDLDDLKSYHPKSLDRNQSQDSGNEDILDYADESEGHSSDVSIFSVAMMLMKKPQALKPLSLMSSKNQNIASNNWSKALNCIHTRESIDPWERFHLEEMPVEKATRHIYNALTKTWRKDEVFVKLDNATFANGAMRVCFRMKKMNTFCPDADWKRDSNNYVAKRYSDDCKEEDCTDTNTNVPRETYFEDIRLQMDAKLWGEEYNRHNPPKKVDIFMTTVYEMKERMDKDGKPKVYHVEHFIEGDYVKYNSNSGFVDYKTCRKTPHAFSHFTFERSGHELIVVDVQGVGDLYTDPQIHTSSGLGYGDGNLGIKGMALFFHSHSCNSICKRLRLSPFSLSENEKKDITKSRTTSLSSSTTSKVELANQTKVRGNEVAISTSCLDSAEDLNAYFQTRPVAVRKNSSISEETVEDDVGKDEAGLEFESQPGYYHNRFDSNPFYESNSENKDQISSSLPPGEQRARKETEELNVGSPLHSDYLKAFHDDLNLRNRTTNLEVEKKRNIDFDKSILGKVHFELAKYHEMCRFSENGIYDKPTAIFHLKSAADCGIVASIISIAKIYCDLPHDILIDVTINDVSSEDQESVKTIGLDYMERSANAGDRASMVFLAQAYDTGKNLVNPLNDRSLSKSIYWLEKIQELDTTWMDDAGNEENGHWAEEPSYRILSRLAEIWLSGSEEEKIARDPMKAGELYNLAAESAMNCMKGKLANKYYMLAEEAYGQVDEEVEEKN